MVAGYPQPPLIDFGLQHRKVVSCCCVDSRRIGRQITRTLAFGHVRYWHTWINSGAIVSLATVEMHRCLYNPMLNMA